MAMMMTAKLVVTVLSVGGAGWLDKIAVVSGGNKNSNAINKMLLKVLGSNV